jgi:hypothetical protein
MLTPREFLRERNVADLVVFVSAGQKKDDGIVTLHEIDSVSRAEKHAKLMHSSTNRLTISERTVGQTPKALQNSHLALRVTKTREPILKLGRLFECEPMSFIEDNGRRVKIVGRGHACSKVTAAWLALTKLGELPRRAAPARWRLHS